MGLLSQIEDRLTLRQQVGIATALLCVILVTAVAAGASYVGREQARRNVATEMAELARNVADRLDRAMSNRIQDAVLFSQLDPLRDVWIGDAATVRAALEQLQETIGYAAWIGFATPDGTVKAATGGLLEGQSVAAMPWFRHGMAGHRGRGRARRRSSGTVASAHERREAASLRRCGGARPRPGRKDCRRPRHPFEMELLRTAARVDACHVRP